MIHNVTYGGINAISEYSSAPGLSQPVDVGLTEVAC